MNDRPAIVAAAANDLLTNWEPGHTIYFRDGLDWGVEEILAELRSRRPELVFRLYTERTDHGAPSLSDTDMYAEVDSQPNGRTAFVSFTISAYGEDMILVRIGDAWRPLTKRMWCR